jgi:hypothetical protein
LAFAAPALPAALPARAGAQVLSGSSANTSSSSAAGGSLEQAASRAGSTGREVAMSLIGLAFAIAAVVLAFRRDFKEAAGVLAIGVVAILLATPAGLNLINDTVSSIVGNG